MRKANTVPWETVGEGDEVSVTFTRGDITVTHAGTIGNVIRAGRERIFETEQGRELFRAVIGPRNGVRVTMIRRHAPETEATLF